MKIMQPKDVLVKLVYLLKRHTEEWANKRLCCGAQCFNNAHLPMFMSIGTEGVSNNELAGKLNVTKQAASKIMKALEADGLVRSEKSPNDARSVMLYMTPNGQKLYEYLHSQVFELEEQYKKQVGIKNYEIAVDVMQKLIKFHEQHNGGIENY
ncbi:MarR family transcriptional regulator [Mucilaginibacter robiniae]|uniref:MarR family transcriptional regulator n=1 Tax=Mucilaginibacter robiniae TaxID=2728022 RepID=A0A7L5DWY9_9SPHI|nr:MarR family transcriptional regulator [Mucilaginibacter robiniae]QJD95271.1 MarR family transcriptional regulator [Mucilaginibacter robiniae]